MQQYSECEVWSNLTASDRCRIVATVAFDLADDAETWTRLCQSEQRVDPVETITAELLPLCAALKFLGRYGPGILRTRRYGRKGRPAWLWGVHSQVRRDPLGRVLVIGTWNYPLFLVGVQVAQALAAGNTVLLKPAPRCESISTELVKRFHAAGVPPSALILLDSSTDAASQAVEDGVDLVVLTGSSKTGRAVMSRAAEFLTPSVMELSGCDAVIVLEGADLDRVAKAVVFGLLFNSGATCIGPRRVIARDDVADALIRKLKPLLADQTERTIHAAACPSVLDSLSQAIERGASDVLRQLDLARLNSEGLMKPVLLDQVNPHDPIASSDLFAPILSIVRVKDDEEAVGVVNRCRYRLAASVFGGQDHAKRVANRLRVGSISINDLIVPTADPRTPFGGRGHSGFGVTRGREGLLAMTVPVSIGVRRGKLLPHLMPRRESDQQTLIGVLQMLYGSNLAKRVAGVRRLMSAGRPASESQSSSDQ